MRILVDNSGYELTNFGDVAMLQVAVARLADLWPEARIEVLTTAPKLLKQFCPQAVPVSGEGRRAFFQDGALLPMKHVKLRRVLNEIERRARFHFPKTSRRRIETSRAIKGTPEQIDHFLEALNRADLCVASGGGYLTDSFSDHAFPALDTLWMANRRGVPTALMGQGLGPIERRPLRAAARRTLRRVDIIGLREKLAGQPFCDALGIAPDRVVTTGDDAIELAYQQRCPDDSPLGRAIGVNVRVAYYSHTDDSMLQMLRSALDRCSRQWQVPLVGTPISIHEKESDVTSINALLEGVPNASADVSDRGGHVQSPADAIEQIKRCRIVVTGSYHAGVFALSQGISVVGLAASPYYVSKFAGLQDQFGVGCHWLKMHETNSFSRLEETLTKAWNEADDVRDSLRNAAKAQIDAGHKAYGQLIDIVDNAKRKG
jgi:colanic acid/amylovoran biosynthesis protein